MVSAMVMNMIIMLIESVKATYLEKESTIVLGKYKALFEKWKKGKQKKGYV